MASVAGRLADRGWGQQTTAVCVLLMAGGRGLLGLGADSLACFLWGILVVDIALPGVHISNQNVIYQLEPEAKSRVNAVYMTNYFIGASSGSALGALAWRLGGWSATCACGAALALLAGGALWNDQRLARGPASA